MRLWHVVLAIVAVLALSWVAQGNDWFMLKDPRGKSVKPVYVEPRIVVSPFRLDAK